MAEVDEIKGRLDILDVVSQYTQLQRSGRSYKAVCPFHTEKTPSFYVFPERQSWRCFGACATGGDVFSFVMRIDNLDFGEALKRLAQQAGVVLPERSRQRGKDDVLYRINEAAGEFFSQLLLSDRQADRQGVNARAYLEKRGLTRDTINKFQLGLSPSDGASLKSYLTSREYTLEQLALSGVVTWNQERGYRDMFRSRLMVPIRDGEGRLAGFGGRALDDSNPKYLNTPRSPIFDKGHILYALHLARDAAREKGIVIVEGYMDAIMAHQGGFSNVVASMGTALTQQQVSLVRRLVRRPGSKTPGEVVLALDPDAAGQEATLRSLESSWNVFQKSSVGRAPGATLYESPEAPSIKVAPLPEGKDPDEIILENPDEWANLTANAVPLMDYLFTTLSARMDSTTPQGKARLAELLFPLIAATPDPFQQDHYFQRLAALLGVSEVTLQASLGRPRPGGAGYRGGPASPGQGRDHRPHRGGAQGQAAATTPFARLDHDPLEEYCLALILQDFRSQQTRQPSSPRDGRRDELEANTSGGGEKAAAGLRLEHFRQVENREVFTNWMECSTLDSLKDALDEELTEHLERLLAKSLPPSDRKQRETDLKYCVRRLEERYLRDLNVEEEMRLAQATDEERREQEQKIIQVNERLNEIFRS